ncbi:MAG: alpha/beta hydrolase [Verrucomicrobiota bacterium]
MKAPIQNALAAACILAVATLPAFAQQPTNAAVDTKPAQLSILTPGSELLALAERVPYKKTPQEELCLYILRPVPAAKAVPKPLPAIIYFTGGGWVKGTPDAMMGNVEWFREQGIIGISADYRVKSRHGTSPVECVKDAKSAIRYVRKNAKQLGIDPNRIIAAGGSAGGHIAAAAVLPGNDEPGEDTSVSTRPNALVLHNPALGLGFREDFFAEHPDCSPILGVRPGWPPTVLSNGTADDTTPYASAEEFVKKMNAAGNVCELIPVQGAKHSCDWPVTNRNFLPTITKMTEFLRKNGIIPPPPAQK